MNQPSGSGDRPDRAPLDFAYYVFESSNEEPTDREVAQGIYLVGMAEARHLQQFLGPLYASAGIGIATSDDEVVSGRANLGALRAAIDAAMRDVERRPPEWPVEIGVSMESLSGAVHEPIIGHASRSRLLEFLSGVARRVDHALRSDGHVHFGGGG